MGAPIILQGTAGGVRAKTPVLRQDARGKGVFQMKKRTMLAFVALILMLLAAGTTVSAKALHIPFTFTEELIGECTSGPPAFPDGNVHFREMVCIYDVTDTTDNGDDWFTGQNTVVVNANLDGTAEFCCGPMWGTFRNKVSDSGYWEGTWTGKVTEQGMEIKARGRGYGELAGLRVRTREHAIGPGVIEGEGVILELPSK
jgi:hypothetical protein